MTEPAVNALSSRLFFVLELPLNASTKILHPEQVVGTFGPKSIDFGALCYVRRSSKARLHHKAQSVDPTSLRPERVKEIRKAIFYFSSLLIDGGKRRDTAFGHAHRFVSFMDWADANGHSDCLAGGEATRTAYREYSSDIEERYRKHEFEINHAAASQRSVCASLEAITDLQDLRHGVRSLKMKGHTAGTEPLGEGDFAHVLGLNGALFEGLTTLVLDQAPFPYRLAMPKSLEWEDDFLWVFPTPRWSLPPHLRAEAREHIGLPHWSWDYENGRIADIEDIWPHYGGRTVAAARWRALRQIERAQMLLEESNRTHRNHWRMKLAILAHNSFMFLFFANTGVNTATAQAIEWEGDLSISAERQGFRTIKWRAQGRSVTTHVGIKFMPALRRFLALRKFLLDGKPFPYLFLSLGGLGNRSPRPVSAKAMEVQFRVLRNIDPGLPRVGPRKLRATVDDWYQRHTDVEIAARLRGHSLEVASKNYQAGSAISHQEDLTEVLEKIASKAKQRISVTMHIELAGSKPLEGGGYCDKPGAPEPIADDVPVKPDCKRLGGCMYCEHRKLIANERDTRKVASAAFLIEQLIDGPLAAAEFSPLLDKADADLAEIKAIDGCAEMVVQVLKDVYVNGNLDSYWAEKYQFFLLLEVL